MNILWSVIAVVAGLVILTRTHDRPLFYLALGLISFGIGCLGGELIKRCMAHPFTGSVDDR
jgi:hypothetical protein